MATLSAVVDIQDRASSKFDRLTASAAKFERELGKVDRKIKSLETQITRLNAMRIKIQVDMDMGAAQAKMAALRAEIAALSASDVGIGTRLNAGLNVNDVDFNPVDRVQRVGRDRPNIGFQRADNGLIGLLGTAINLGRALYKTLSPVFELILGNVLKLVGGVLRLIPGFAGLGTSLASVAPALASAAAGLAAFGVVAASAISILAGLSMAVMVLASALTSLLVPLAALVPIVGAFFGGIAFGILPIVFWTQQTKKLVDQKKQLQDQLSKLTPGTQEYIDKQKELNEVQKELNQNGGEFIFGQLTGFLDDVKKAVFTRENRQTFIDILGESLNALRPLLPIISEAVSKFGQVFLVLIKEFSNFTKSAAGQQFFRDMINSILPTFYQLGQVLGQVARLFGNLMIAAAPITEVLLADFVKWLGGINDRLSKPGGMKGLKGFFEEMYPVFKDVVLAAKDFVVAIIDLGRAGAPLARSFFGWLREVMPKIVDFMVALADKYGPLFLRIVGAIFKFVRMLWNIVEPIASAFLPIAEKLFEIAGFVADIITKLFQWSAALDPIGAITDVIKGAWDALALAAEAVVAPFRWLWDKMKDIADFLGKSNPANWFGGQDEYSPGANAFTDSQIIAGNIPVPPGFKVEGGKIVAGADGAIVRQATMALIGEAGPEAVVPLNKMPGAAPLPSNGMGSMGGGITVTGDLHFHGVQNVNDFVREIKRYMNNLPKQSGGGLSG
jgi:hypothetical protein